jgi:hypothetical protein
MNDSAPPPSPELFNRVDEYIASIHSGAVNDGMALDNNTAIYAFYENFFLQFFPYIGKGSITGFDEETKAWATRLRISLTDPGEATVRALICRFEDFCNLRSDLSAGLYFASRNDFLMFHMQYIPDLLQDIGAWAAPIPLPELAQRAQRAFDSYQAAVAHLTSTHDD